MEEEEEEDAKNSHIRMCVYARMRANLQCPLLIVLCISESVNDSG
jgi:hypothetical protein